MLFERSVFRGTLFLYVAMSMTVLDIILAVPMLWLIYRGWRRGLVREVITLAGVVAGIWAATHMTTLIAEALSFEGENAVLAAFFVAFVGALALAWLLGILVERIIKMTKIGFANRLAGAVLGLAKALCILAVLLNNIVLIDKHESLITPKMKEESMLYKPVWNTGNRLTASLKQFIDEHKDEWKEVTE